MRKNVLKSEKIEKKRTHGNDFYVLMANSVYADICFALFRSNISEKYPEYEWQEEVISVS